MKNDTKDARVIAQLMKDGRYAVPNLLAGVYAELSEGVKLRDQLTKQLMFIARPYPKCHTTIFPRVLRCILRLERKSCSMFATPISIFYRYRWNDPWRSAGKMNPYVKRGVVIKRAIKLVSCAKKERWYRRRANICEAENDVSDRSI